MLHRLTIMLGCLLAAGTALVVLIAQDSGDDSAPQQPHVAFTDKQRERLLNLSPLPDAPDDPTNRVADETAAQHLGRYLFFDTRFSKDNSVSCATCHDPQTGFNDASPRGRGMGVTARHTPSLWNVAYNRWFGWDGAADTLWSFALHAIENPKEHGSSRLDVAHALHDDEQLRQAYENVFGPMPNLENENRFPPHGRPVADEPDHAHNTAWQSMTEDDRFAVNRIFANFGKALAAYQRQLISDNAPFDQFVKAMRDEKRDRNEVLSPSAQRGAQLFVDTGRCFFCHNGPNFTDGEFHNIGVPPAHGGRPRDPGRYRGARQVKADPFNAAGRYSDDRESREAQYVELLKGGTETWGQFKTPSLRNVARTEPYMHQGQFATLREVIKFYSTLEPSAPTGHHQEQILQPLGLTDQQIADLLAFLESLTDEEIDSTLLSPPKSPLLPGH